MRNSRLIYRFPFVSPAKLWALMVVHLVLFSAGCRPERNWDDMIAELTPEQRRRMEPMNSTPMVSAGVEKPQSITADQATLRDSQEVIGVIVQGQPRAYSLDEMSGVQGCVVNDYVVDAAGDPRAFTVTYCDLTECIRVFDPVSALPNESLEMGTVGLRDGGLALFMGDQSFKQEDSVEQLRDVPHERMTWDRWKAEHPDTLVYIGIRNRNLPSDIKILRK